MKTDLTALEQTLGVTFQTTDLLRQALVHRSYLNEHRNFPLDHNERLEFLGDAVLELVVTEHLYNNFPNPEGELTTWRASLVNAQMLAVVAEQMKLQDYLYLSKGEAKETSGKARQSILANAVEAIIGALYLDQGYEPCKQLIDTFMLSKLAHILQYKLYLDAKSRFQETAQDHTGITPNYKVISETGPDHEKTFVVAAFLDTEEVARGKGLSKQEAQMKAAEKALAVKGWGEK